MSITEYKNRSGHALRVLPRMQMMYLPDENRSILFFIATTLYGGDVFRMLEDARLPEGGDFMFHMRVGSLVVFEVIGTFHMFCTAHAFMSEEWLGHIFRLQRWCRRRFVLGQRLRLMRRIGAFARCGRLSSDVMDLIAELCLVRNVSHPEPLRRVVAHEAFNAHPRGEN